MSLLSWSAPAQEVLRSSLAAQAMAESRSSSLENMPYTVKSGDFRLLVTSTVGLDYNDNINTGESAGEDDFILRPMLHLDAIYPVTRNNVLTLNVGVGYDHYFQNDEYSGLRLAAGSQLGFNIAIKDFVINLHDRFSFVRDSAGQSSLAGGDTADYGNFQNAIGILGTWNANDLTASLGYDHVNYISDSSQFDYQDRATEMFLARAGARVHPTLVTGVEGTVSLTSYDERILNDSTGYSAGIYGDWNPGRYFRVQPRVGYAIYDFDQTGLVPAEDSDSYYFDITLSHDATEWVRYSLSLGHEMQPGAQSDLTETTYVRPSATWRLIRDWDFTTSFSYEHGEQGVARIGGTVDETYDWFSAGLSVSHPIVKRVTGSLSYRHTTRLSDSAAREYNQNLVGIMLSYRP